MFSFLPVFFICVKVNIYDRQPAITVTLVKENRLDSSTANSETSLLFHKTPLSCILQQMMTPDLYFFSCPYFHLFYVWAVRTSINYPLRYEKKTFDSNWLSTLLVKASGIMWFKKKMKKTLCAILKFARSTRMNFKALSSLFVSSNSSFSLSLDSVQLN